METIILILMVVALVALIIGLVNPSLIMRWSDKPSRWKLFGWYILINVILMILLAIGSANSNNSISKDEQQGTSQQTDNKNNDAEILKNKVADEIKSWGAKDAYFNEDNYFVYCVDPEDLGASADEVAKAMFPNVEEVPGVKGCIVLDFKTKKELGKYDAQ